MRTFTRLLSIALVFLFLVNPTESISQTLWPGDVNNNGVVNGNDAIYWAYAQGSTGPIRPNATTDWVGQPLGQLWSTSFPDGINYAYADCDGNGIVDEFDYLNAIVKNCGETHGEVTPDNYYNGIQGVDPSLCLDPESSEVYAGEMLNIDLRLGDDQIDVADFQAITFTVSYDGEFVEQNSNFMLDMSESWVDDTGNESVSLVKNWNDTGMGEVTMARTSTSGSIQNGSGKIGRVSIVIEDVLVGLISNDTMNVKIDSIHMIDQYGISQRVAPACDVQVIVREARNPTNCPSIVNPVCGTDGVTYINCCYAAAAGVSQFTTGVCYSGCIDEHNINLNANCSNTYNPVCGCNDVTYLNSCVADAYGVQVYSQGPCSTNCYDPTYVSICGQTYVDPNSGVVNLLCPQTSDPVCGCDGITYTNSCYAQASGMSFYTPGPCANNCVDANSMDPNLICPSQYNPVCGCNGVTYTNSCYADAAGVLNYSTGSCGASSWCSEATQVTCGDFLPNETTIGAGNNINSYPGCSSGGFAGPDKVYVINKNTSGDLQIGIEIMTPGMDLDMFLLTDDCNQVTCVKSSTTSNNISNNEGIIYEDAPIGTYYLVIDGQYAASAGNFRLEINCGYLNCDNSVHLTCGVPVSLNNSTGTDEVSLYGCDGNILNVENNGPEMIHTFTTTTAGPVDISLYGLTSNLELFMLRSCDRGDCVDYSQNPGTSNEQIEAYLQPGTYYVVVDGYNGAVCDYNLLVTCASNCSYNINATASASNCGATNGAINITSSGGAPGFIIQWDGPVAGSFSTYGTNCTVSGLPGGVYTVTATDANGCEDTAVVTIDNSETNLDVTATPNAAECMDQGSISVHVANGTPYYEIFITGPTSGSTTTSLSNFNLVNLDPGTYTLQIVDANGCSNTQEVVIGHTASDFAWTYTVTDAACGGTGVVHVQTYNGVANYNIIVSGPTSGSATTPYSNFNLNNLPGGTYEITVEDGNWCQVTQTVVINDSNLTIGLDANNGLCGGTGSIDVSMSNGNPGYSVAWTGPQNGTASTGSSYFTIDNLSSGSYSVTVTDGAGCTDYQVITVSNTAGSIDFDVTAINGSCGQAGSIWLGVNTGTAPYTITWSGPAGGTVTTAYTNYDIPWLPDGTYLVQVTDADGCSSSESVTVNNSMNNLEINTTPTAGMCDQPGSIWVSISNGTPGYSISWSGPSPGSTNTNNPSYDIANLTPGVYTITVVDGGGCTTNTNVTVESTEGKLTVAGVANHGSCGNYGSIDLSIGGGQPNYSIHWSGPDTGTGNTVNMTYSIPGLPAGSYVITLTDDSGCTATTNVTVNGGTNNLTVTGTANNGVCGNTGSINIAMAGGTSPYTVAYSGASSGTQTASGNSYVISGAVSGSYNITVTDANNCSATTTVAVANGANNLSVTGIANNGICGNNGSVDLTLAGGAGPYDVVWTGAASGSATATGNGSTISGATSGNYNITVTDNNGCTATTSVVVDNSINNFSITGTSADGTCYEEGSLWIYMHNGTANYTVAWDGPISGSAPTTADSYDVSGTPAGSYLVTVTDANGCVATTTIVVNTTGNNLSVTGVANNGACGSNGSVDLTFAGGTSPYTVAYTGAGSATTTSNVGSYTITGAVSGNYNITVTDANGCSATTTVAVNNAGGNAGITLSPTNGACGQSGSIVVSTTGTAPYAVSWSGAGTGTATSNGSYTITNAAAGAYTVNITDANGCAATGTVTVTSGSNITATSTAVAADCNSGYGSISIAAGGTPSYTVVLAGPTAGTSTHFGNNFTIGNLAAGTYSIAITDANGCSTTITEVVGGSGCCMTATMTGVDANCGVNGSIWIDVYNGAADYAVSWTGPSTGANSTGLANFEIPNLVGGTYVVTITGADGCTLTQTVAVNTTGGISLTGSATAGACGQNGSATLTVSGGTPGYTVSWAGGSTTSANNTFTVPNLPAGPYAFTVTDANGCTGTQSITVTSGSNILAGTATAVAASCANATGSINVTMTGGSPNYTVVTTGPSGGTTTHTGNTFGLGSLAPGTYSMFITDANGCSTTVAATVAGPGCCMTATMTGVDGTCGTNGSIWVDVYNGAADYAVSWTGASNGSNTTGLANFEIPNLNAGSYVVTIVDAAGCTVTQNVTVAAPSGVDVTVTPVNGTCGSDGSVAIVVNSGAPGFDVSWTGAGTGSTTSTSTSINVPNLAGGSYTFTLTDANGCASTQTVTVSSGANTLTATSSTTAADCASGLGAVTITVAGGTPNYTVTAAGNTNSTTVQNGNVFTLGSLAPGSYNISISDANGCYTSLTAVVGDPGCCMTATMTGVNADCGSNGSIWIDVFNGAPNYTVTWTGASSGTNSTGLNNFEIPNLPGGAYVVTLVDSNGCTATQNVTVTSSGGVAATLTPVDGACGQNGAIAVNVTSGTPGFTVSWIGTTPGSTTSSSTNFDLPNLAPGTYVVTITDANGCTTTSTVAVTSGSGTITATSSATAADCASGVGSVTVSVAGGSPNYTVTTSAGTTTQTGNTFTLGGLAPGSYTISIADANGCSTALTAVVPGPGCCMTATMTGVDAGCGTNGSIWIDVFNGAPNYMVTWTGNSSGSNSIGIDNFEIPSLTGGSYVVTLTDANGCTVTQTVTVNVSGSIDITAVPNNGACGSANGSIDVSILSGTAGYTVAWTGPSNGSNTINGTNFTIPSLAAGTYTIEVTDADGCTDTQVVTITTGTNNLTATATPSDADCVSGLGSISVAVANGAPTYSITVAGPSAGNTTSAVNGFTLNSLLPGAYTITIVDANGCTTTATATVGSGGCCMTTSLAGTNGVCGGAGTITVSVANGAPNYAVTWTGGGSATATTSPYTITGVAAGTYTVTVVDAAGCSSSNVVTITTTPAVTFTATPIAGACGAAGSIDVVISTGTPGYTVAWTGGSVVSTGTTTIPGLTAGTYPIVVTDANGCTATQNVVVTTGANNLTATATASDADCVSGLGSIAVAVANGAPIYNITVAGPSGGTTTSAVNGFNLNNLLPGAYTITIIDANGCTTSVAATVADGGCCMTTSLAGTNGVCGGAGTITVSVANGAPNYAVTWTGGGSATATTSPYTITGVAAGTYTVTVVDAAGCSSSNVVTITTTPAVTFTATPIAGACGAAGSIDVTVLTGTPGYTVVWPGGSVASTGTTTIPGLVAGTYPITITDANGCTATENVVVTIGADDLVAAATASDADCVSGLGSIALAVSNGSPIYNITVAGPSPTTMTSVANGINFGNLLPGVYTITVVDGNGCTTTVTATVADGGCCMTTSLAGTNGVCGGAGTIAVSVANGTPNYTITWTGGGSATATTSPYVISGVAAGTYTVTVVDAAGCTSSEVITITTTPAVTFTATPIAGVCGGAGSVDVVISTGTPGYTVTWPAGSVASTGTTTIPGLAAGTYPITVTDANGCTATQMVVVTTGASDLTATAIGSNASCATGLGHISFVIANGAPIYNITLAGPSAGTTTSAVNAFNIDNLLPGAYTMTIVDANGCTTTVTATITDDLCCLTAATAVVDATCGNDGSVLLTMTDGTAPYSVIWTGGIPVVAPTGTYTITGLGAGFYTITVVDAAGCEVVTTVTIGGAPITATSVATATDCVTGLGAIVVSAGGTPSYVVAIAGPSGGSTTALTSPFTLSGLLPGVYTITLTDANGCNATTTTEVLPTTECCLGASFTVASATCGPDGSIAIAITNGIAPYTIVYTGGTTTSAGNAATITGIAGGTYVVTITDAAGCTFTETVVLPSENTLTATAIGTDADCVTGLGDISVSMAGGVANYTIVLSGGPTAGTYTATGSPYLITGVAAGTYTLTITDANGCVTTTTVIVNDAAGACCLTATFTTTAAACGEKGLVCIEAFNGLADYTVGVTGSGSVISDVSNFCFGSLPGTYEIVLTDANGCTITETVTVEDDCCEIDACFTYAEGPNNVNFTSNYSGSATYIWSFGDGTTATMPNPNHTFPGPGNYDVCLTVTTDCGTETCCETVNVVNGFDTVIIRTGLVSGATGTTIDVPVTSENCELLTSFSGSLITCDDQIAQIVGIIPAAINPLFNATNNTFTYFDFNGQGVPCDDEVLFYIQVELVGTAGQECEVMITCDPLPCEVGGLENGTGVVMDHVIYNGTVGIYAMFRMDGMVRTFWMDGIMAAEVNALSTAYADMNMTDSTGHYDFPQLIGEETYVVAPEKDTLPANGLSTFALFIGQQFILGLDPVEIASPYQIIAGDANCNNSFTALDLFLIQQIIIGTATEFPSCPSWVFVCEDHPLPTDFNSYNVFPYANSDTLQLNQDSFANFVGVKVGDILGNANPYNIVSNEEVEGRSTIAFNIENNEVKAGETFTVDFRSSDFEDFVSFQMALNFAKDKMSFVEVINNDRSEMANLISGVSVNNDAQVRLSWFNLAGNATSLKDTEVAFSAKFKATTDIADLSEVFTITKFDTFKAEAHNHHSEAFNITLEFVDPANGEVEVAQGDMRLLQNVPNPFNNSTIIRFELPEDMKAKLVVTNALGQVVTSFSNTYPKGMNQVELNRKDLPSGLYNYTLTTDSFRESRSMIIID